MDTILPRLRLKQWGLVASGAFAAGVVILAHPTFAQEVTAAGVEGQEVTIYAPEVTRKKVGRSSSTGAPIEVDSVTRHVSYADLDLTKPSDVDAFRRRISDTAKSACDQVDKQISIGSFAVTTHDDCVRTATNQSMSIVEELVSAAQHPWPNN